MLKYTVRRSARAKAMRIEVRADSSVIVVVPERFGMNSIERFVSKYSDWARRAIEKTRKRIIIRLRRSDIPALKLRALAIARERCAHFARLYGVSYGEISIRAQRTRWGSCSHRGNLSFNYRIAALPEHLRDYVIVHELCHLREMNHSKRFWELVARTVPLHRILRKELRNTSFVFE